MRGSFDKIDISRCLWKRKK